MRATKKNTLKEKYRTHFFALPHGLRVNHGPHPRRRTSVLHDKTHPCFYGLKRTLRVVGEELGGGEKASPTLR